ncbi:MAG: sigma 54-interacting transcriptional regulator [Desulforhopalus sp.]
MRNKIFLDGTERDFFRLVSKLTFSNPFEAGTFDLACRIAGGRFRSRDLLNKKLILSIRQKLDDIVFKRSKTWKDFSGEDRELIRVASLYDAYHGCMTDFDELIIQQIDRTVDLCTVPFAHKTLSLLYQRGFEADQALQYFAFYYQLRRAWYFIFHGLIGKNPSMEKLRAHLWRSVFTHDAHWYEQFLWNRMEDFSTFLVGETGTGKGTAAAAVGRSGYIPFDEGKGRFVESFMGNFIEINLSQFPESLIESELFGHQKGAFTGAIESHKGVFALCSRFGSIFLDEIGEVSMPVQIKLLKVLEERNFTPVGSHEKSQFSGRIIAATNKSISELRESNIFRRDFYYRLCSNVITVPTLRKQIEEEPASLEVLLRHTIQRIVGAQSAKLEEMVLNVIGREVGPQYHWPGNVRELEQAVRCVLLNNNYCSEIEGWCEVPATVPGEIFHNLQLSAHELLSVYCKALYKKYKTYEKVSQITELDARTVKKHIQYQSNIGRQ